MNDDPRLWPEPPRTRRRGRHRTQFDKGVHALRDLGHLDDADAPMVAVGRAIFDLLDQAEHDRDESRFVIRAIAAEARMTYAAIRDRHGTDDDDAAALAELFAPLGDPSHTGPAD